MMSYRVGHRLSYGQLDLAINDILASVKPSQEDHERRETVAMEFKALVTSLRACKDAKVEPFGSFLCNLYSKNADLDMSVDVSLLFCSDADLIPYIGRALVERGFTILNFAPYARIPVLTFESKRWNIACDVTVNNHLGLIKSKFLSWISKIDTRFRDMVLLVKEWARAQNINDPKKGTFNSYALCLLIIFHFQTCEPAILPPLKDIYAGNVNFQSSVRLAEESRMQYACATNVEKFIATRAVNRSTLSQLMVSFLEKFSQLNTVSALRVISTYSGKLEGRIRLGTRIPNGPLIVEDPLDPLDNAARTVKSWELTRISLAFEKTRNALLHAAPDRSSYRTCLLDRHTR